MSNSNIDRREFLGLAGIACVVGSAGCTDEPGDETNGNGAEDDEVDPETTPDDENGESPEEEEAEPAETTAESEEESDEVEAPEAEAEGDEAEEAGDDEITEEEEPGEEPAEDPAEEEPEEDDEESDEGTGEDDDEDDGDGGDDDDENGTGDDENGDDDDMNLQDALAVVDKRVDVGHDTDNEFILFENTSSSEINLSGHVVTDRVEGGTGIEAAFPSGFTLGPGDRVRVTSGSGSPTADEIFMNSGRAVWRQDGDEVLIVGPGGDVVFRHQYGDGGTSSIQLFFNQVRALFA